MRVRTKLRGAFAVYIALLAGLSLYHIRATRRAVTSGRELAEIAGRLRVTSNVQLGRIADVSSDAQKYLITRDEGYLDKLQQTMRDYDGQLRQLDLLTLSARERAQFAPLSSEWNRVMVQGNSLGAESPDSAPAAMQRFQESLDRVHTATQSLGAASQEAMSGELVASEQAERATERVTMIGAAGAVILSLLLSALLARSILEPLGRLTEGAREMSAGRFGHRLTAKGNDELAQVTREFNSMAERLDELDRMKSEFVSKVSHDLKTPLSSMQETNGVMLEQLAGPLTQKQRQLLEINQDSAQRLSGMLAKLLDLSRIEAGVEPERQVVDVRPLVRESLDHLTDGSESNRVSLAMSEPASRLLARGDAEALTQVFENLIENALKFSPVNGQVRVSVVDLASQGDVPSEQWSALRGASVPGALLVTVSDEGPGVPDADKERIFDRFYQTPVGRSVRSRGVGLGLAICRETIKSHGGAIWVSDNEPQGSVFCVLLPGAERVGGDASAPALAGARVE
ncbi:MAG TPA: ATP-binding protein [Gemmatimonadaceae bacterium]|nr:ATP-binding protein [Gemmatimonadaceae bacterium]